MDGTSQDQRQHRSSDGSDGLPPLHRKRKKKGKGSLQTTSAPLSPNLSGDIVEPGTGRAIQPLSRLSMSTGRVPVARRATMSDAGQVQDGLVDVTLQLAPVLDRCCTAKEPSSKAVSFIEEVSESIGPQAPAQPAAATAAIAAAAAGLGPIQQQPHSHPHHQQPPQQQQHSQSSHPLPKAASAAGSTTAPTSLGSSSGLQIPPMQQHQLSAVPSARTTTLQPMMSLEQHFPDPPPSLWDFFYAEATPCEKYPTADVLWRQTERDRVYNFLLHVPYQLERIMIFGTLLCLYSFLGALTVLPLRCLRTLWQLVSSISRKHSSNSSSSSSSRMLPGAQLYDLLCVLLLLAAVGMLSLIKPGVIYYWMKDITSEFLKIQVIFTALEILDKILSNFGVDVLEALSSTCTLFTRHSIGLRQLVSDFGVALLLITAHGSVLMCQAMVFAVTMNSKANALLALMIATNFVELKGQVYKRTDTNKLWTLACQDIVERFELLLVLGFVVVEDISNSGTWVPAASVLLVCARIFMWEVIIDIAKHAVLGKFNDIRPGIYREYMRDLCSDSLEKHSHNTHKLVGFCPLGPAALCLRMMHTLFTLKADGHPNWQLRTAVVLLVWLAACAFQVVLGYSMKWLAYLYVQHHAAQAGGKTLPRAINVTPAGTKLAPTAAAAAAVVGKAAVGSGLSGSPAAAAPPAVALPPVAATVAAGGLPSPRSVAPAPSTAAAAMAPAVTAPAGRILIESKSLTEAVALSSPLMVKQATHSDEGLSTATDVTMSSSSSSSTGESSTTEAAGFSSSYAAPSAAGLSLRVYTRSPSCADFPIHGVKQVAVEQH